MLLYEINLYIIDLSEYRGDYDDSSFAPYPN